MEWRSLFDTVGFLGSVASVVALIQVGRVWSRVRQVERSFRQQQCLPKYSKKLRARLKNLEFALAASNRQNATTELECCRADLENSADLVQKTLRLRVLRTGTAITRMRESNLNDTEFFVELGRMIADIAGIQRSIENYVSEQPWRRTNGN